MADSFESVLAVLTNRRNIDTHTRRQAAMCIKQFFVESIQKHDITDISDEDIEELAYDLTDELCSVDYSYSGNN